MSTIRVAKRNRFTTIDRRTIRDARLSFRARGVLVWLLDHPDDWSARSDVIAAAGVEGRDAIRAAMRELEALGYLVRIKSRNNLGQWEQEVLVFERPHGPGTGNQSPGDQAPDSQALQERLTKDEREDPQTPYSEAEELHHPTDGERERVGASLEQLRESRGFVKRGAA